MDFSTIGSLQNHIKNQKMQLSWEQKKKSGDVTSHNSPLDAWLDTKKTSDDEEAERSSAKLKSIMQKVYAGAKLTAEEKRYLQAKDPETYQDLQAAEREQKAYEQELRRCKTKEDVQRLKMSRMGTSLARVKSVENNPNIPPEKKQQILSREKYRCDNVEKSTRHFVEKGGGKDLPTEAEKTRAEKELKEAEEARRRPQSDETHPAAPEQPEDRPNPEQTRQTMQKAVRPADEELIRIPAAPAKKAYVRQTPAAQTGQSSPVRDSPEIRKLRRSKKIKPSDPQEHEEYPNVVAASKADART